MDPNEFYLATGNSELADHENTLTNTGARSGKASDSRFTLTKLFNKIKEVDQFRPRLNPVLGPIDQILSKNMPSTKFIVHDPDDRRPIVETKFPYNAICLLKIKARGTSTEAIGTGFFVSERCVLTAGHCVFSNQNWMESITVIPGVLGSMAPYGQAVSKKFRSVEGWTVRRNSDFDYGAIILQDNFLYNQIKAFMGYSASIENNKVEIAGYPSDKSNIPKMARGLIHNSTAYRFYYDIDTDSGNSGSPVFNFDEDNIRALGIHTDGGNPDNYGIRFRPELLDRFNEWIRL